MILDNHKISHLYNSYKNPHLNADTDIGWLNEYEEEINKLKKRKEEIINRKV